VASCRNQILWPGHCPGKGEEWVEHPGWCDPHMPALHLPTEPCPCHCSSLCVEWRLELLGSPSLDRRRRVETIVASLKAQASLEQRHVQGHSWIAAAPGQLLLPWIKNRRTSSPGLWTVAPSPWDACDHWGTTVRN
jgi:hypothetical protein